MKKTLISLAIISMLSGCAVIQSTGLNETDPTLTTSMKNVQKEFDNILPPAAGKPLSVAVYSFADKTGQRRPQANVASLSSAVTQGAETFLISALQNVGRGQWFEVVERVGIDNLTKERLIIRQMREAYEGSSAKPLMPMQFAGIIVEGGIVGYDSTSTSGGAGMRIFGIGKQTQWSTDTVTVSLRAVSVNTGKVLATVAVQKTILSTADSATALRFFDAGTQAFEAEAGLTINEPGTYAVKAAIELAVVELIKEGAKKSIWDFKMPPAPVPLSAPIEPSGPKQPVISSEIRKPEEKKDELVPTQTSKEPSAAKEQPSPVPQQSNDGKASEGTERKSETAEGQKVAQATPKELQKKLAGTWGTVADSGQDLAPKAAAIPAPKEPQSVQKTKKYKTSVRTAVRKEPEQQSRMVDVILPGQTVTVKEERNGWALITLNNRDIGWVAVSLLKEEKGSN